jgi:hypothetical protein
MQSHRRANLYPASQLQLEPQRQSPVTARNPDGKGRKDQINVRASEEATQIMAALQDYWGISQAAIIEMLLRDKARELGLRPNVHLNRRPDSPKDPTDELRREGSGP